MELYTPVHARKFLNTFFVLFVFYFFHFLYIHVFFFPSTDGKQGCNSERLLHTLHLNVKSSYAVDALKCIYCNSCNTSIKLIASLQGFLLLWVRLSQICHSSYVNLTRFQPYLTSVHDDMMFSVTLLHVSNMWRLFIEPNYHCSPKLCHGRIEGTFTVTEISVLSLVCGLADQRN